MIAEVELNGITATVTIEHGYETAHASLVMVDDTGIVLPNPDRRRFGGYCDAEITYMVLVDALFGVRQIEASDIGAALDAIGLFCVCDD